MRVWTAHLRRDAEPVLLREGFSLGRLPVRAALAGRAGRLDAGCADLVACLLIALLAPGAVAIVLAPGLAWLVGLTGRDLVRWSMAHRGYIETHVVVARTEVDALGRLLAARPDLVGRFDVAAAR